MNKEELLNRMKNINKWIEENPEVTEPNMYEMIDCVTQLGIIARTEGVADMPNKFPEQGSELAELYSEWNKMYKARVSWDKVQDENFSVNKNTKLYAYFTDLNMRCCTGEFRYPEDEIERAKFLECTRKIGSVSLYINQQKLQDPNFEYDNEAEYKGIVDAALKYEYYLPVYSRDVIDDISSTRVQNKAYQDIPGDDDDGEII